MLKVKISIKLIPDYKGRPSYRINITSKQPETIGLEAQLTLVQQLCIAEDFRYPQEKGYKGRKLFIEALIKVCNGEEVEKVLNGFGVKGHKKTELVFENPEAENIYRKYTSHKKQKKLFG